MRLALTLAAIVGASVGAQSTDAPTLTVSTVVASPIASQTVKAPIFCAGDLLQTVNLATLFADPKTFVDKPTRKRAQEVLNDFNNVTKNATSDDLDSVQVGSVLEFVETDLRLIRGTNSSSLCDGVECESSLIPLNQRGRFREQYYWDSFWIVEGLLESELYDIVNGTLYNFMDELERLPPLFVQMLARYVEATNETAILERRCLWSRCVKELAWFATNRTIDVTSPTTNRTYAMARYAVNNTAPRPESYLTDYRTANPEDGSLSLSEDERGALYAELASGAESGWDYTARWIDGAADLTKLNVKNILPVDLNSILYRNHMLLANLYDQVANGTASDEHRVLDLFWNSSKLAFYDFNIQTREQSNVFSTATFYPLWSGIIPDELLSSSDAAFGFFSSVNLVMSRYNGTYPTTFLNTGLQWDAPNAWPPHVYIAMQALRALPDNVTSSALPTPSDGQSTFALVPEGQLGLLENALPGQPVGAGVNASTTGAEADLNVLDGTVVNGGNATDGEGWGAVLQREMANRYVAAALCSWLTICEELNITNSINNTGNMFEKFSNLDIDSAGSGGEYTVQAGFGWTNGVVLWTASRYGDVLVAPRCPNIIESSAASSGAGSSEGTSSNGTSDSADDGEGSDENAAATHRFAGAMAATMMALAVALFA
ncbi:Six-hairpin glycosidase-like protein [Schizophyllum amplum]|uniref:Trehalase n=1 Tax=Schizophyllum amplum TaxID=97359 RepID=A0A550CBQ7_9AGAR|nr:Six-hairpin glycosidase-like protein [Auriculariopsis ampla]